VATVDRRSTGEEVSGSGALAVNGLGNLAAKVADLDAAVDAYRRLGAEVDGPEEWRGSRRADVRLGPVLLTLFERAVYEDDGLGAPREGFLHAALFVGDLDSTLEGTEVAWGPSVVEGSFGRRRIAFVDLPGIRLEFMEELG
jgi:catechol 2,3-dioxygenase-like lactoylglutathione lyase family enzyme